MTSSQQNPMETEEQVIAQLARVILSIDTLQTRHSDSLDFHEVAVWNVREALSEAFHAGARSVVRDTDGE